MAASPDPGSPPPPTPPHVGDSPRPAPPSGAPLAARAARAWKGLGWKGKLLVICGAYLLLNLAVVAVYTRPPKLGEGSGRAGSLRAASDEGAAPQSTASPVAPRFRFTVTDLGTLGGTESDAQAINSLGQVVGGARTFGDKAHHAFLWDTGRGMQDLGTLGGPSSSAQAINDAGQIVGSSDVPCQDSLGDEHAFLCEAGRGMQDLGSLGTRLCSARGINKTGQVVGYGSTLDKSTRAGADLHAFQWDAKSGMRDMANCGIRNGWASSINDSGQVVGLTGTNAGPDAIAFLWQAGRRMRDLGSLGGQLSWAFCINNAGQVVGLGSTASGRSHAFLWEIRSGMKDLGALGEEESAAFSINNAGQVVGGPREGSRSTQPPFLYSDGKMTDLNTMIDPASGWHLTEAKAINDSGQIVGTGKNKAGQVHAFLLTPDPTLQSATIPRAPQAPASQSLANYVEQKPPSASPVRRTLRYKAADLRTLGGNGSHAISINNSGQVVGYSDNVGGQRRAFLWETSKGMRDLGTLGGLPGDRDLGDEATGINNKGQVVGTAKAKDTFPHVFLWEADRGMQDLGRFGGLPLAPEINDNGAIAVTIMGGEADRCRAVLWQAGRTIDVDTTTEDCDFFASAINNRGQIAGMAVVDMAGARMRAFPFLWRVGSGVQKLGTLGGDGLSVAHAVNDNGSVVGGSSTIGHDMHAFIWQAGRGMRDLGSLGGACRAYGVNNAGEIVGGPSEREGGSHPPFLYSDGKMTDLNTLTDLPSGWHLKTAAAINDSGQIVGNGQNGDAQFHAFLLTPVP